ncbi:hypothetical protein [Candidatus Parabeggiatoa sp. HSG14]|uniref:hypothetical protein n=1 Tax=Candidatus Parabeggiatoa sp. HSG14 TaxID=3055593 RepID=UPI0025A8B052|nr:hypothetical protein [Thiotrichales bacterium HSG14]
MKNKTNLKESTVACAFLIASSPVWAANTKMGGGALPPPEENRLPPPTPKRERPKPTPNVGKSSTVRISSLAMAEADKKKMQQCSKLPKVSVRKPKPKGIWSLTFDPNEKQKKVTLQFTLSDIPSINKKNVLLLLYSRCLSKKPQLKTPSSKNTLALAFNDLYLLESYDIPATPSSQSSSDSSTISKIFEIDLETDKLAKQVEAGNTKFYFQAGLLTKADFDKQYYEEVRLSPMVAVHFSPKACLDKRTFSSQMRAKNLSCKELSTKN